MSTSRNPTYLNLRKNFSSIKSIKFRTQGSGLQIDTPIKKGIALVNILVNNKTKDLLEPLDEKKSINLDHRLFNLDTETLEASITPYTGEITGIKNAVKDLFAEIQFQKLRIIFHQLKLVEFIDEIHEQKKFKEVLKEMDLSQINTLINKIEEIINPSDAKEGKPVVTTLSTKIAAIKAIPLFENVVGSPILGDFVIVPSRPETPPASPRGSMTARTRTTPSLSSSETKRPGSAPAVRGGKVRWSPKESEVSRYIDRSGSIKNLGGLVRGNLRPEMGSTEITTERQFGEVKENQAEIKKVNDAILRISNLNNETDVSDDTIESILKRATDQSSMQLKKQSLEELRRYLLTKTKTTSPENIEAMLAVINEIIPQAAKDVLTASDSSLGVSTTASPPLATVSPVMSTTTPPPDTESLEAKRAQEEREIAEQRRVLEERRQEEEEKRRQEEEQREREAEEQRLAEAERERERQKQEELRREEERKKQEEEQRQAEEARRQAALEAERKAAEQARVAGEFEKPMQDLEQAIAATKEAEEKLNATAATIKDLENKEMSDLNDEDLKAAIETATQHLAKINAIIIGDSGLIPTLQNQLRILGERANAVETILSRETEAAPPGASAKVDESKQLIETSSANATRHNNNLTTAKDEITELLTKLTTEQTRRAEEARQRELEQKRRADEEAKTKEREAEERKRQETEAARRAEEEAKKVEEDKKKEAEILEPIKNMFDVADEDEEKRTEARRATEAAREKEQKAEEKKKEDAIAAAEAAGNKFKDKLADDTKDNKATPNNLFGLNSEIQKLETKLTSTDPVTKKLAAEELAVILGNANIIMSELRTLKSNYEEELKKVDPSATEAIKKQFESSVQTFDAYVTYFANLADRAAQAKTEAIATATTQATDEAKKFNGLYDFGIGDNLRSLMARIENSNANPLDTLKKSVHPPTEEKVVTQEDITELSTLVANAKQKIEALIDSKKNFLRLVAVLDPLPADLSTHKKNLESETFKLDEYETQLSAISTKLESGELKPTQQKSEQDDVPPPPPPEEEDDIIPPPPPPEADDGNEPPEKVDEEKKTAAANMFDNLSFLNVAVELNKICDETLKKVANADVLTRRLEFFREREARLVNYDQWDPAERKKYQDQAEKNKTYLENIETRIEDLTKLSKSLWVTHKKINEEWLKTIKHLNSLQTNWRTIPSDKRGTLSQEVQNDIKKVEQLSKEEHRLKTHKKDIDTQITILKEMQQPLKTLVSYNKKFEGADEVEVKAMEAKLDELYVRKNCLAKTKSDDLKSHDALKTWIERETKGTTTESLMEGLALGRDATFTTKLVEKTEIALSNAMDKDKGKVGHLLTGNNIPIDEKNKFNGVISMPTHDVLKLFEEPAKGSDAKVTSILNLISDAKDPETQAKNREAFWSEFTKSKNDFSMDSNDIKSFLEEKLPRANKTDIAYTATELARYWKDTQFPALIRHAEEMNERHFAKGKAYLYGNEHMRYAIKCYREAKIEMVKQQYPGDENHPEVLKAKEQYKYVDTVARGARKPDPNDVRDAMKIILENAPEALKKSTDELTREKMVQHSIESEVAKLEDIKQEIKDTKDAKDSKTVSVSDRELIKEESLTFKKREAKLESETKNEQILRAVGFTLLSDKLQKLPTGSQTPIAVIDSLKIKGADGKTEETQTTKLLGTLTKPGGGVVLDSKNVEQKDFIHYLCDLAVVNDWERSHSAPELKRAIRAPSPTTPAPASAAPDEPAPSSPLTHPTKPKVANVRKGMSKRPEFKKYDSAPEDNREDTSPASRRNR